MLNDTTYEPATDLALLDRIRRGDRSALEQLIQRHYGYIYNIALKFFNTVPDAEDAAQEVVIKIITNIGSYDPERGALRTWLYRIVFNHYLDAKKSGPEKLLTDGFRTFFGIIDDLPVEEPTDAEEVRMKELIEEAKVSCMAGMLMCLDRQQRLTYIVGELFEINHQLAAEIFDITPANFRKRLSRARKELYNWMTDRCGLVNTANPCRCPKKTRAFVDRGFVDPKQLKWNVGFSRRIHDLSHEKVEEMLTETEIVYRRLYRAHPYKDTERKGKEMMAEILG
ncbi:MAG: RNA polymerase sigma factor, partial [Bacteroidota bacterium]